MFFTIGILGGLLSLFLYTTKPTDSEFVEYVIYQSLESNDSKYNINFLLFNGIARAAAREIIKSSTDERDFLIFAVFNLHLGLLRDFGYSQPDLKFIGIAGNIFPLSVINSNGAIKTPKTGEFKKQQPPEPETMPPIESDSPVTLPASRDGYEFIIRNPQVEKVVGAVFPGQSVGIIYSADLNLDGFEEIFLQAGGAECQPNCKGAIVTMSAGSRPELFLLPHVVGVSDRNRRIGPYRFSLELQIEDKVFCQEALENKIGDRCLADLSWSKGAPSIAVR